MYAASPISPTRNGGKEYLMEGIAHHSNRLRGAQTAAVMKPSATSSIYRARSSATDGRLLRIFSFGIETTMECALVIRLCLVRS
jgi:hypothetical protein